MKFTAKQIDLENLVRPNIRAMSAYSSARSEFSGSAAVFLDANESPFDNLYNRYPDPLQKDARSKIATLKGVSLTQIFLGNGSDEAIDLLIRAFCEPGKHNVAIVGPTYGMYRICAEVNNVATREVLLNVDYTLDAERVLSAADGDTRIIFLCSPNNPTGNQLDKAEILHILKNFDGIVVIDEAYIDFSDSNGFVSHLDEYANLVILQTFSKAWGLAGIRAGVAIASPGIISILDKIKYPYNISTLTQNILLEQLNEAAKVERVKTIRQQRTWLLEQLAGLRVVKKVFTTDANFILVKVNEANIVYTHLLSRGIVVRNRSNVPLCENALRLTVGTQQENQLLINALAEL